MSADNPTSAAKTFSRRVEFPQISIKSPEIDIFITVKNSQGEITRRGITVHRLWAVSLRNCIMVMSIEAHCHLRNECRDFNIQGIIEAFEYETGPAIWDLPGWLLMMIAQGKKRSFDKARRLREPCD
jgi:hypothetical protein